LLTISKAKSRAASVGGRFQFKQPDDVAYWRKADSRCEQPKKRVTNGTMARSSARRSIKKKKARVHYAADPCLATAGSPVRLRCFASHLAGSI
jgi:hypothetical protein